MVHKETLLPWSLSCLVTSSGLPFEYLYKTVTNTKCCYLNLNRIIEPHWLCADRPIKLEPAFTWWNAKYKISFGSFRQLYSARYCQTMADCQWLLKTWKTSLWITRRNIDNINQNLHLLVFFDTCKCWNYCISNLTVHFISIFLVCSVVKTAGLSLKIRVFWFLDYLSEL